MFADTIDDVTLNIVQKGFPMLVIAIVAIIATTAFYRQAKLIGIHPGKAASIPFITAGIFLAGAFLASIGIAKLAIAANASIFTVNSINFMMNAFLVLAYLFLIRQNWIAILNASNKKIDGPRETDV